MKTNPYYRSTIRRENIFVTYILSFFDMFASYGRLPIEVFTRKSFGQRYFRLSSALTVASILALFPLSTKLLGYLFPFISEVGAAIFPSFTLWYIFLAVFVYFSVRHYLDIKKEASVTNFKRFSLSSGVPDKIFDTIKIPGIQTNIRTIECLFEPLPFFLGGLLLWIIGQQLGLLLVLSSVIYSLSYLNAYRRGDNFILDKIDEMICNEQLETIFSEAGKTEQDKSGFEFRGLVPTDAAFRKTILPNLYDDTNSSSVL